MSLSWPTPNIPNPVVEATEKVDYLRLILDSNVYDICSETPLIQASKLSARLGSTIYLKREDMQSIFSFKCR